MKWDLAREQRFVISMTLSPLIGKHIDFRCGILCINGKSGLKTRILSALPCRSLRTPE
jgi:hypothetical protein